MTALLKTVVTFLTTFISRMFRETLRAFLLPITYAISAWVSVWTLRVCSVMADRIVYWVKDPGKALWQRAAAAGLGVFLFPALFPMWAARKMWKAVEGHTGFGLGECDPFPQAKI
jgi:hypothetical protein